MVVLAVFALCALTFHVIWAEKLSVCDSFPTARRTSTFSVGFAAVATTVEAERLPHLEPPLSPEGFPVPFWFIGCA